jgi:hypothetical protein
MRKHKSIAYRKVHANITKSQKKKYAGIDNMRLCNILAQNVTHNLSILVII